MALFCGSCGKELPDDARFCSSCGQQTGARGFSPSAGQRAFSGLLRPREGRMIAGVCLGIAIHNGWDATALRVIAVILGIFLIPFGGLAYLICWLVIPEEPHAIPPAVPITPAS